MANTTETVDRGLLWLRPVEVPGRKPAGTVATLEGRLADAAGPIETVHSVYHALLHLIRGGTEQYAAAIVCVDEIEHAELEFFTIIAQHPDCPAVYVYGHERSLQKLGRAIELGATGEATPELARRLAVREAGPLPKNAPDDLGTEVTTGSNDAVADVPVPAPQTDWPVPVETASGEIDAGDDALPHGNDTGSTPTELSPTRDDIEPDEPDDETEMPVRVPWRNDEAASRRAPHRQPPPQRTPPSEHRNSTEPQRKPDYEPEPLLTEEELRALIGDDDPTSHTTDTHGS